MKVTGSGLSWGAKAAVVLSVMGIAVLELQGASPPVLADAWFVLQPIGGCNGLSTLNDAAFTTKFTSSMYIDNDMDEYKKKIDELN